MKIITLLIGPKVLIIDLKKSDNLNKEIRIDFDENINLESFFYFKNSSKYKLIGVISKYYQYGAHSQIISFCKSTNNNNWYKYNDSIVSLSSFNDIKKVGTAILNSLKAKFVQIFLVSLNKPEVKDFYRRNAFKEFTDTLGHFSWHRK